MYAFLSALLVGLGGCDAYDDGLLAVAVHDPFDAGGGNPPDGGVDVDTGVDAPDDDAGVGDDASAAPPDPDGGGPPVARMDATTPMDDAVDASDSPMDAGFACGPVYLDEDRDGTEDCEDGCPSDGNKVVPGYCGCGYADTDDGVSAGCPTLRNNLVHRYRFDGSGAIAVDSEGGEYGVIVNTTLAGTGALDLNMGGDADHHVVLPSGIISGLPSATIELWVTWRGTGQWERLFDFGVGAAGSVNNCTHSGPALGPGTSTTWYYFCTNNADWVTARANCQPAGGVATKLVQIDSEEEQAFIVSGAPSLPAWIGANDRDDEDAWYWTASGVDNGGPRFWQGNQGGSAVGSRYTAWRNTDPDSAFPRDCAVTRSSGWGDEECTGPSSDHDYVCEAGGRSDVPNTSLYLTPNRGGGAPRMAIIYGAALEPPLDPDVSFPASAIVHVAAVFDDANGTVSLYLDGVLAGSGPTPRSLSDIQDRLNYIGRSHYGADSDLNALVHEFRIYDTVLSADLVALSGRAGPDPSYLE